MLTKASIQIAASQIPAVPCVSQQEVRRRKERRACELLCHFAYGEFCQQSVFTSFYRKNHWHWQQRRAAGPLLCWELLCFSSVLQSSWIVSKHPWWTGSTGTSQLDSWAKLTASNPLFPAAHFFSSRMFLVPHQYLSASTITASIHEQHVYWSINRAATY